MRVASTILCALYAFVAARQLTSIDSSCMASASSAAPSACDAVTAIAPAGTKLVAVPDSEHVALAHDAHDDTWCLVSSITFERVSLPRCASPPWQLCVDDDADVFVCSLDGDTVLLASDVLQWTVWQDVNGRRLVVPPAGARCGKYWVDEALWHYDLSEVRLQVGMLDARLKLAIAVFEIPLCGSRLFWSLPSVVRAAGINVAKKYGVGRWLCKGWGPWMRLMSSMQLDNHMLKSVQYAGDVARHGLDSRRMLPWGSCTSAAVLCLLACWSFSKRGCSGLDSDADRAACASVMESILLPARQAAHLQLRVFLDEKVRCAWPAPCTGEQPVHVFIDSDQVDVGRFRDDLALCGPTKWHAHFLARFPTQQHCSLVDFFAACFGHLSASTKGLALQLVLQIGSYLDAQLSVPVEKIVVLCRGVEIHPGHMDLENMYQLERDLVRYREASIKEAGGESLRYLSGSTDKSRVYGKGLANTCFVKPSNVAWWAPPQAMGLVSKMCRTQVPCDTDPTHVRISFIP